MDSTARRLLQRWQALRDGNALKRAASMARTLWVIGLLLALFAAYAIVARLSPVISAAAAGVCGWVIAESNALRTRIAQWPIFKEYVDWSRVQKDLGHE